MTDSWVTFNFTVLTVRMTVSNELIRSWKCSCFFNGTIPPSAWRDRGPQNFSQNS